MRRPRAEREERLLLPFASEHGAFASDARLAYDYGIARSPSVAISRVILSHAEPFCLGRFCSALTVGCTCAS